MLDFVNDINKILSAISQPVEHEASVPSGGCKLSAVMRPTAITCTVTYAEYSPAQFAGKGVLVLGRMRSLC
jgi:hypothetical protein